MFAVGHCLDYIQGNALYVMLSLRLCVAIQQLVIIISHSTGSKHKDSVQVLSSSAWGELNYCWNVTKCVRACVDTEL